MAAGVKHRSKPGQAVWRNLLENLVRELGRPVSARDMAERYVEDVTLMYVALGAMRRRGNIFIQEKRIPEGRSTRSNFYNVVVRPAKKVT